MIMRYANDVWHLGVWHASARKKTPDAPDGTTEGVGILALADNVV